MEKTKVEKKQEKENSKISNQPEQITLTPYTGVYMIVTLIAAATAMLSMIMLAKPAFYFLQDMIGTAMDDIFYDLFSEIIYFEIGEAQVYGIYIMIAVLSLGTAVLTMIGLMKAMKPDNKPALVLNVVSVICAIAAIISFICEGKHLYKFVDTFGVANEPIFGVYKVLYILLICNIVAMVINALMNFIVYKRWSKTGRTSN